MHEPAFGQDKQMGPVKRWILGVVCTAVALGVLGLVCHLLETFKEHAGSEFKQRSIPESRRPRTTKQDRKKKAK